MKTPHKAGRALLWITSGAETIFVYTYQRHPKRKVVFFQTGVGALCSDTKGDVFVFTSSGLYEYRHGAATPIATIDIVGDACSVDAVTGNLAVVSIDQVTIFRWDRKIGWHLPTVYGMDRELQSGGYDASGNLFVDGGESASSLYFAELPKGSKTFLDVNLNQAITVPGTVQWDGSYITIFDRSDSTIYRFAISGSTGTEVGAVDLARASAYALPYIHDGVVLAASGKYGQGLSYWRYPGGGKPFKRIPLGEVTAVTLSVAP